VQIRTLDIKSQRPKPAPSVALESPHVWHLSKFGKFNGNKLFGPKKNLAPWPCADLEAVARTKFPPVKLYSGARGVVSAMRMQTPASSATAWRDRASPPEGCAIALASSLVGHSR
jgi:hypothetical protein